jgi:hypothetical protein
MYSVAPAVMRSTGTSTGCLNWITRMPPDMRTWVSIGMASRMTSRP